MRHLKMLKTNQKNPGDSWSTEGMDERSKPGDGTNQNFEITVMSILKDIVEEENNMEKETRISAGG